MSYTNNGSINIEEGKVTQFLDALKGLNLYEGSSFWTELYGNSIELNDEPGDLEHDLKLIASEAFRGGISLDGDVRFISSVDDSEGYYVVKDGKVDVLCGEAGKAFSLSTESLLNELARRNSLPQLAQATGTANYVLSITYSFDTDYLAVPCHSYEEAKEWMQRYLAAEVETVKEESEYQPSVIALSDDETVLVYEKSVDGSHYKEFEYATYKIMELGNGHNPDRFKKNNPRLFKQDL